MSNDNVRHVDPLHARAVEAILAQAHDDVPIILPLRCPLAMKVRELDPDVEVFDADLIKRHWGNMTHKQRLTTRDVVVDVVTGHTGEPCTAVRFYTALCWILEDMDAGKMNPPWMWTRYKAGEM